MTIMIRATRFTYGIYVFASLKGFAVSLIGDSNTCGNPLAFETWSRTGKGFHHYGPRYDFIR